MQYRDPIFKGATKPAMMLGVPVVPLIIVIGIHLLLAIWSVQLFSFFAGLVIMIFGVLMVLIMRAVSAQDDQKLNQYVLRLKSIAGRRNSAFWGAHSVSPNAFKKRI